MPYSQSIERETLAALLAALLALLTMSALGVHAVRARESAASELSQAQQNFALINLVHADITELAATQDNYVISRDQQLQTLRTRATKRLTDLLERSGAWQESDIELRGKYAEVQVLVRQYLQQMDAALNQPAAADMDAYMKSPLRRQTMATKDAINAKLGAMVDTTQNRIAQVRLLGERSARMLYWMMGLVLGLGLLLLVWLWRRVHRDLAVRRQHAQQLQITNSELAHQAHELKIANQELESFCYSVSHDLRNPLLSIDGYAQILESDYRPVLDGQAQRYIQKIRAAGDRMGRLIDDLLTYSKLGRQAVQPTSLDMTNLAHKAADMAMQVRGVRPQLHIQALALAWGDENLLHFVWLNLIDNAIKYSSKVAQPRIAIDNIDDGAQVIYRVSDNGAGFDMSRYAELFGVFQRLHASEDFPGTGVGLAIVERIVSRHGGRVWAEGKPGEGATFYFSLPRYQVPMAA